MRLRCDLSPDDHGIRHDGGRLGRERGAAIVGALILALVARRAIVRRPGRLLP